jgi:aminopeptidase N
VVPTVILQLTEATQTFDFSDLQGNVVPPILRDLSAPVKLVPEAGAKNQTALAFLAARDIDGFNKWEARQKLYTSLIFQTLEGQQSEKTLDVIMEAF